MQEFHIESFGDDGWTTRVSRGDFETICKPIFDEMLEPIREALEHAALQKEDISEVIMVGGSTRIPYVRNKVYEFFDGKNLNHQLHPDECVATGAAMFGHMLASGDEEVKQFKFNKTYLAFGVEAFDDMTNKDFMDVVIPKDTPYPVSDSREYVTHADNQTMMLVKVMQANMNEDPSDFVEEEEKK